MSDREFVPPTKIRVCDRILVHEQPFAGDAGKYYYLDKYGYEFTFTQQELELGKAEIRRIE